MNEHDPLHGLEPPITGGTPNPKAPRTAHVAQVVKAAEYYIEASRDFDAAESHLVDTYEKLDVIEIERERVTGSKSVIEEIQIALANAELYNEVARQARQSALEEKKAAFRELKEAVIAYRSADYI